MPKTIATHDGKFHADDVFAVAALLLLEKDAQVTRTRDERVISAADFVVDVGGAYDAKQNRFDHHQVGGAGARDRGVPYAAFGLVWKKYGSAVAGGDEAAARIDAVLVAPIDANDNGIDLALPVSPDQAPYVISEAVRAFVPTWQEGDMGQDAAFMEAVAFARRIIEREVKRAHAFAAGREQVLAAYAAADDKRLIVLDEDFSWKDTLAAYPEPLFVVHPQNDTWRLYSVRDNPNVFENRKDLPEAWAGLRDAELAEVTGVPDAMFAHRNRFMAVAKTREGALALAKLALTS